MSLPVSLITLSISHAPSFYIAFMQNHTKKGGMNIVSAFTNSNPIGTRPYLFPTNELEGYYADWEIGSIEYKESSIAENGELATYAVVRIAVTNN